MPGCTAEISLQSTNSCLTSLRPSCALLRRVATSTTDSRSSAVYVVQLVFEMCVICGANILPVKITERI